MRPDYPYPNQKSTSVKPQLIEPEVGIHFSTRLFRIATLRSFDRKDQPVMVALDLNDWTVLFNVVLEADIVAYLEVVPAFRLLLLTQPITLRV